MQIDLLTLLLIILLVFINAFFAASEIALLSARRVKIQRLMEKGNQAAKILLKLKKDPNLFLATIQVGITLAGFLASATAAVELSHALAEVFTSLGIPPKLSYSLGIVVVTVIISFLTLVFGELVPKRLAMQWSEKISLLVATPINYLATITSPIIHLLTFSTNVVVRLVGGNPDQQEKEVTEEEIRLYIAEHRTLQIEEKRLLEGVFNFGDQVVRQVMVPRTEITYLHADIRVKDALQKVCQKTYSTFPVYEKDYDNILGLINIHQLACQAIIDDNKRVVELMSPATFVPETKHTLELLKELRQQKIAMAIIVDEYGGTAGLVTQEDLVDEIIGDVTEDDKAMHKTKQGQWFVAGDTPIQEVIEELSLKRITTGGEYETIAGFILAKLGHLPEVDETVYWEDYKFQVKEMAKRRIKKILVTPDNLNSGPQK